MGQYEDSLGEEYRAIVRSVTRQQLAKQLGQENTGTIFRIQGMTIAQSLEVLSGSLWRCGAPFFLPFGDGGANGLSFTGTRGVFTLSAESPIASSFNLLADGCFIYLPAGAGGLAGGWYQAVMTNGTNGEVFADTYTVGSGVPVFAASPTALPDCTPGRITQSTAEITACSFTLPGGVLGPNGIMVVKEKTFCTSSAGTKLFRVRAGTGVVYSTSFTNTFNDELIQSSRINMGRQNRQVGNKTGASNSTWDCGTTSGVYSNDVTTVDTSVDQTVSFTIQNSANVDSSILVPMQFLVQYGE